MHKAKFMKCSKCNKKTIFTLFIFISIIFIVSISMLKHIENSSKKYELLLKQSLVQEAIAHFDNMVITRSWNAGHGGVFVKQNHSLKPNPYLKNNFIKSNKDDTLIKINPAWMTRQISEISNNKSNYYYKITSLKPINPNNKADSFETEALQYLEKNRNEKYYYNINTLTPKNNQFDFLGKLVVTNKCMQCHSYQGYSIGDIRGGIRVSIPTQNYTKSLLYNKSQTSFLYKIIILVAFIIILTVSLFLYKNYQYQIKLESEKKRFQNLIDLQNNIVIITDGKKINYGNKSFLHFFDYINLQSFLKDYNCICGKFEKDDDYFYLDKISKEINWIDYLYNSKNTISIVKILDTKNEEHSFSVFINKFDEKHFIVTFSDISNKMKEYLELEKEVLLEKMIIAESRVNAMSDMVKMISHQWNQPLTSLSMINLSMIADIKLNEATKDNLLASCLDSEKEIDRLSAIIDNFNNIYTPVGSLELNVNIVELIESILNLIKKEFKKNQIEVKFNYSEKVLLDTHSKELAKIILYILHNAKEAIIRNKIAKGIIKIDISYKNDFVVIKIEDNGKGIKDSILSSIFEPYFTTKEIYNEAGLSLFIAKITLEHFLNGSIEVKNTNGGALFTIILEKFGEKNE